MRLSAAVAAFGIGSIAHAQVDTQCPGQGLCYSLNIPDATAASGDGDIFFQISASTEFSWVAMGQGDAMAGAQIFVLYTDASGTNVTLSPRLGVGHVMPEYNSQAQVTLLEGSGVSDGKMIANVKCSSCNQWEGGSMDFSSSSASFIFAALVGDPLDADESATISRHSAHGDLDFSLAGAKGGQSLNPFAGAGNGGFTTPTGNSDDSDDEDNLLEEPNAYERNSGLFLNAHGLLASIAIVILYPIGAIIVRLLSFSQVVWLHAGVQFIGTLTYIAAFGLGVYIANNEGLIDEYHPIIGIVVFVLIILQPILGMTHHRMHQRYGRRTVWSHAHIWAGRIIITLGIINGGLGLMLAGEDSKAKKYAYGIVAGIMWLLYVAASVFGEMRKRSHRPGSPSVKY